MWSAKYIEKMVKGEPTRTEMHTTKSELHITNLQSKEESSEKLQLECCHLIY